MELEQVVIVDHAGRRFTFRVDRRPPLDFWRVESEGQVWLAPVRVSGDEAPGFFRGLADVAMGEWGWVH